MRLKHPLKHFTYTQIEECLEKMNRYSTSAARDLAEKNVSPSPFTWILSPLAAFIKGYFLKLGFLDGTRGFILATYNAHYHFSKYAKLRILSEEDSFKN